MSYPSLAEVKAFMGIAGADQDTLLQGYRDSAVAMVERLTGRVFVAVRETRTYAMNARDIYENGRFWLVPYQEFVAFTGVTNWDALAVGLSDYDIDDADLEPANFGTVGGPAWTGLRHVNLDKLSFHAFARSKVRRVSIDATWGFSAACPADLQQAILLMCEGMYHKRRSQISATQVSRANAAIGQATWVPAEAVGIIQSYVRFS